MILEESLTNIIRAADPDDYDDVAIRNRLVAVLRDIAADLEPALEEMAGPPGAPIDGAGIATMRLGEGRPQALRIARRHDEVDMTGH